MNITQASASTPLPLAPGDTVTLKGEAAIHFTFNIADAIFERSGHDLVVDLNGEYTVIRNFFIQEEGKELPQFLLVDGTVVDGKNFLLAQTLDFDISTAAGPEGASSSGLNNYSDGTGSLVDGVDRLNVLRSDPFTTKSAPTGQAWLTAETITGAERPSFAAISPITPTNPTDNDHIIVNAGRDTINGIFIHGDSVSQDVYEKLQHEAAGSNIIKGSEGNQTINDDGSAHAIIGGNSYSLSEQNIFGNDTIEVHAKEIKNSQIHGGLGNDSIIINADAIDSFISGDEENLSSGVGGNDEITIAGMVGGFVGGDAGNEMKTTGSGGTVQGGDDTIIITNMSEGRVGGDSGGGMQTEDGGTVKGGNDEITVIHMKDGVVAGDAAGDMWTKNGGTITGGDDVIKIIEMESGTVSGDAGEIMQTYGNSTIKGGHDKIAIDNLSGGYVGGDAGEAMSAHGNSTIEGGNDTITIKEMTGGVVAGDAGLAMLGANIDADNGTIKGGDDEIRVDIFQGGTIYGDTKVMAGNVTAGNDTISIGELNGADEKYIYGDAETNWTSSKGNNTFIYDNKEGHKITLDDGGNVKIFGANGADITAGTNTTISGFSNIGGGDGNDTLEGNSSNNILVGGAGDDLFIASFGNDTMTGGTGKDTFQWNKDFDYQKGTTTITDFTVGEDKLEIGDLLEGGGSLGNLGQLKAVFENNTLTLTMEGADFAKIYLAANGPIIVGGANMRPALLFMRRIKTPRIRRLC
ncbi:hypothetical protein AAG570_014008 [Ranatra chinensis]|uniref:Uncharacterized protein n=1 Tax=Ranatra chinensis TaxID=642074 RepID=A0ABD0XS54_9HEMI